MGDLVGTPVGWLWDSGSDMAGSEDVETDGGRENSSEDVVTDGGTENSSEEVVTDGET